MKNQTMTVPQIRGNDSSTRLSPYKVISVPCTRKLIKMPVGGQVTVTASAVHASDFSVRWNQRMDEFGAERGSVQDLRAI